MGIATTLAFFLGSLLGVIAGAWPQSSPLCMLSIGSLALYAVPGLCGRPARVADRWQTVVSGKSVARLGHIAVHLILPVASLAMASRFTRATDERNLARSLRQGAGGPWSRPLVDRVVHVARMLAASRNHVGTTGRRHARRQRRGGKRLCHSRLWPSEAVRGRDTPLLLGVILAPSP